MAKKTPTPPPDVPTVEQAHARIDRVIEQTNKAIQDLLRKQAQTSEFAAELGQAMSGNVDVFGKAANSLEERVTKLESWRDALNAEANKAVQSVIDTPQVHVDAPAVALGMFPDWRAMAGAASPVVTAPAATPAPTQPDPDLPVKPGPVPAAAVTVAVTPADIRTGIAIAMGRLLEHRSLTRMGAPLASEREEVGKEIRQWIDRMQRHLR